MKDCGELQLLGLNDCSTRYGYPVPGEARLGPGSEAVGCHLPPARLAPIRPVATVRMTNGTPDLRVDAR